MRETALSAIAMCFDRLETIPAGVVYGALAETLDELRIHTDGLIPFQVELGQLGVLEQDRDGRWSVVDQPSLR